MKYDFDTITDRRNTASIKWDLVDPIFQGEGLLPMWVADMDFPSPPEVIAALEQRARHGIFGYTAAMAPYYEAAIDWMKKRHDWEVSMSWFQFSPGVVPALNLLIQTYTDPGDKVIIQKPVYYPFMSAINGNGRVIANNPLKLEDGRYTMDFLDLEVKAADPSAKLMILCSPHNPVGRVWTKEELIRAGEICINNDVLIIADEIHHDLVFTKYRHTPFASISDDFLSRSITCTSPSKTFNLAGLQTANLIIADEEIRKKYTRTINNLGILGPNTFGIEALTAAYRHGEEWLDQLLDYLQGNLDFMKEYLIRSVPGVSVIEPEGTYLAWLDFRELGLDKLALKDLMIQKARVALDHGYIFGSPEGDGFERINIACPRKTLKMGLDRIKEAC